MAGEGDEYSSVCTKSEYGEKSLANKIGGHIRIL